MQKMKVNQEVLLEGRGNVVLKPADHLATGGEGSIYRVGTDTVVKIYLDPGAMHTRGMPEKIKRLSALASPFVIAPRGRAFGKSGEMLGFHMPFAEGEPLSRTFTNDFYTQGFTAEKAATLVLRMKEAVSYAHAQGATLVDANEFNWLVESAFKDPTPQIVDVDSWAIGRWQASAIMPSIRDWHSRVFDEKSDWFSWGIVTFQVFTGIHPYKGTLDGFRKGDFTERMKANASVFTKGVRLNQAVRDFGTVPARLLQWYEATFQNGERSEPPSPFDTGKVATAARIKRVAATGATGLLIFEKILGFADDPVVRVFSCGAALLRSGRLLDIPTKTQIGVVNSVKAEVVRVPSGWFIAESTGGEASFRHVAEGNRREEALGFRPRVRRVIASGNRLFLVTEQGLSEVRVHDFGGKVLASAHQTWGVLTNSTTWFDGVGVEDALGAMFLVLPVEDAGVLHIRTPELDGLRIIAGTAGHRFVALIAADKAGTYRKISLVFYKDLKSYRATSETVDQPELNMALLPKGVGASIEEDGTLTVFVPANGSVTEVKDRGVRTDMVLSHYGDTVAYIQGGALWSVKMA